MSSYPGVAFATPCHPMATGLFSGVIFIDLKKAFDTVDHDIFIAKLRLYGVEGVELDWFIAYLNERKQCCRVNGKISEIQDIKYGVPQASCLGPLLFLIYINNLPLALQRTKVTMYADDKSISYSSRSITDLTNTINSDLQDLSLWLQGNMLTLNVVKTHSMILGTEPNLRRIYCDSSTSFPLFE